jgi:hypothetical protein
MKKIICFTTILFCICNIAFSQKSKDTLKAPVFKNNPITRPKQAAPDLAIISSEVVYTGPDASDANYFIIKINLKVKNIGFLNSGGFRLFTKHTYQGTSTPQLLLSEIITFNSGLKAGAEISGEYAFKYPYSILGATRAYVKKVKLVMDLLVPNTRESDYDNNESPEFDITFSR